MLDVTDPAAVRDVNAQLLQRFPDLDVLVTMAGIMLPEDAPPRRFPLRGGRDGGDQPPRHPSSCSAALTEHLATRPRATIMTVSSGLAFVPLPIAPTYNATKAAVHSFTESLRVQLADTSVEVLELVPPGRAHRPDGPGGVGNRDAPRCLPRRGHEHPGF
ncbi:SDR family NAD(P)-dependent oxidoreductase [Streptomyces sp. L7]